MKNLKVKFDVATVCKYAGLALTLAAHMVSGIADKKQNEAYLDKLFNDKFANKN